jgi:tetratricopeptide (TPR) repeat protein
MKDEQKITVWSLVKNDEFEKACELADEEYVNTEDVSHLRNKIYALFHLKKYSEVISVSKKVIEIRKGETDSDFLDLGIANWLLGKNSEAVEAWQKAQYCKYTDAAGGIEPRIYLYFVAVKTKQDKLMAEVIKGIKKILKGKRSINWPGAAGHYLLNEFTDEELISCVSNTPILRERQLCQAYFVMAIKKLERKDEDGYYDKLKGCISYGPASYLEQMYYLATGELEEINK